MALSGTAAGVAFLAACAAPAAAPQAGGEAPAAANQQLVFWGHDQHPIDLAAEGFVELHPEVEWVSPHPADAGDKIMAAMAAGSGVPDLYWAEATDAQDWGCNELLTNLTSELEAVKDDYHPLKLNEAFVAKHGHYVGWPGDISVSGWYYREDKLAEAGFGDVDFDTWTWNDFFEMAAAMREQGMYSFVFPADGWNALFMFTLHQVGGTAVSQDGQTILVGDEKGIAAMQIVKQMWDSGGGLDVGWWSAPYWAALKEGTLVADFAAAWARGFWEAQLTAEDSANESAGQWRIAKFPGGDGIKYRTGIWGGAQLVNPIASTNTEGAIEFMKYALGSVDGAARCGNWGIIPSYRPYLESEEFTSMRSPVFGDWAFNEFWREQEKELSTEFYRPAGWAAINTVVGKEMVPIMLGEVPLEEGMARIVDLATPDFERTKCA
jgi:lactose/L-arabinose transport system substrate-binding protein